MRRGIKGLLLGIAIGLFGSLFGLSPYGVSFERNVGLDWLFTTRGAIDAPADAVVIAIDGFTGDKLGIAELPRDWPRSIHGELVDVLVELGAATIVFDLDFHKPRSAEDELVFAQAIERSGRVVLFQQLIGKGHPLEDKSGKSHGDLWVEKLLTPIPVLAEAATGMGPFPLPRSQASVHEFWVFKSSAQEMATMPAVGLQVYALKIHDRFSRLLEDSGFSKFMRIPQSATDFSGAAELSEFMIGIRDAIDENPQLADNLARELRRPWVDEQPAETRRLLQSLAAMYIGDDVRFLNFYGPPGTFQTIPYQSIIEAGRTADGAGDPQLAGKVAFVGYSDFYDPNQPDRFHTVFTSRGGFDLSGVEIAATAFANLLHDQSLRLPSALTILLILFWTGFLLSLLVYFAPASLSVPACVLIAAAYVFYAQLRFEEAYLWLPLATPILVQLPLALLSGLLAQYFGQRHKVQHISEAISVYVPEDISRALISQDLMPEDLNRVSFSTCLATDMEGFTSISERMEPGKLAEFLNDYFDTLARPMQDNQVTVTDFRADAIMCAWTGQQTDPEVRRRPILASLQAASAIEEFRARHDAFESALRIGMETGEVYIGHSGGGGNLGYRVVGDCANSASRIEGLNKYLGTRILATESVIAGLDGLLARSVGQFVFVGKSNPLSIIEIVNLATEATPRQSELCERFTRAIEYFMNEDWKTAARQFESILETIGEDGPARFYLSQCLQRIEIAPRSDDPAVIHLNAK